MNSMLNWLVILPIITIKHLVVSFNGVMNAIFRFLFGNDFIGLVIFVKTQCRLNVDFTVNRVSLSYVYWCHLIRSTFGFICFCKFVVSMILLVLIIASMHFSYLLRAIHFMRFEPWVGSVHELWLIVMGCRRLYS